MKKTIVLGLSLFLLATGAFATKYKTRTLKPGVENKVHENEVLNVLAPKDKRKYFIVVENPALFSFPWAPTPNGFRARSGTSGKTQVSVCAVKGIDTTILKYPIRIVK